MEMIPGLGKKEEKVSDKDPFKAVIALKDDEILTLKTELEAEKKRAASGELQNSINLLKNENGDLKAVLNLKTLSLERLERSLGLSAAKNIILTPNIAGEQKSLIDTYNSLPDSAEKSAFYRQHQAELSKFILTPQP